MSLKMSKTRIYKSYENISLLHSNSTGSNKPHTKCQLTPRAGFVRTLDMVMFAANFEITENDQNIYKPWIGSPDDYLYTGIYHSSIEFSSFTFYEHIYEKRAN